MKERFAYRNRNQDSYLKLLVFFFFFSCSYSFSQFKPITPHAEISILTIDSGTSLNDAFGHSAYRINDSIAKVDVIFDYGRYDFNTPNFYLKFAQGKLNYLISRHNFSDFFNHYVRYNRTIEEQVLNLSDAEKQDLFNYLETNYKPENRRYLYDFFYDNCATKMRDVVQNTSDKTIVFNNPENFKPKTFRALIYEHVNRNSWGSFGIDIALGSVIDKEATHNEHMYLPKYIFEFCEQKNSSKKHTRPTDRRHRMLFKTGANKKKI